MASDCSPLTTSGYPVICTPTNTGYNVRTYQDATAFTNVSVVPALVPCAYENADAYELGWLVFGVLATAWIVRMIASVLGRR